MGLDLRFPIGLMFSLVGLILAGYGLITGSNVELYKRSLGININLVWGIFLLVFGIIMLVFAMKGNKSSPPKQE
ncbi:MAG: hypothetical protein PHR77_22130 [Kiritimatiellae bacterium]|nr:hypothetical protein [Kiritimatiellia bacterium]MDD5520440.1 hypothetical protein [Kiritimatiellia bacterium]